MAVLAVLGWVLSAGCGGASGPSQIESRFAEGQGDWTVVGDAEGENTAPTFRREGGNPAGYVSASDDVTGGVWFWNAPPRYLGDRSAYYGGTLSFDLKQSDTDSQFDDPDVVLESDSLRLYHDFEDHPRTDWTHYEVSLVADQWRDAETEDRVTEDRLRGVLSNLTAVRIRGEYREGFDTGALDNVVLSP